MEVTRSTFQQTLPLIDQYVSNADFVSIDLEFTGVKSELKIFPFDSSQKRYEKLKTSVSNYIITQMGVCTFRWENDRCVATPFNIWIFPREFDGFEKPFRAQPSSLTFLRENNFDFNKWIDEGVGFLSKQQAEYNLRVIRDRKEKRKLHEVTLSKEDKEHMDKVHQLIQKWKVEFENDSESQKPLILPSELTFNSYLRLIIHQEVAKKYPDLFTEYIDNIFIVRKIRISREEEDRLKLEEKISLLDEAVGARHVIDILIKHKKPVIGHNMMVDMMQIYHSFISPLPMDADDYKKHLHEMFPTILDTKKIATIHQITEKESFVKSTALGELYKTVATLPKSNPVEIQLESSFNRYNLTNFDASMNKSDQALTNADSVQLDNYHEAGFDALLTGACFIHLGLLLGNNIKKVLPKDEMFSFEVNKISFFRNTFDLTQHDDTESRKMFFFFTGVEGTNNRDISMAFDKVGRTRFHRIDEDSGVLEFLEGQMTEHMENEILQIKRWNIRRMIDIDKEEKEELLKQKEEKNKLEEKRAEDRRKRNEKREEAKEKKEEEESKKEVSKEEKKEVSKEEKKDVQENGESMEMDSAPKKKRKKDEMKEEKKSKDKKKKGDDSKQKKKKESKKKVVENGNVDDDIHIVVSGKPKESKESKKKPSTTTTSKKDKKRNKDNILDEDVVHKESKKSKVKVPVEKKVTFEDEVIFTKETESKKKSESTKKRKRTTTDDVVGDQKKKKRK